MIPVLLALALLASPMAGAAGEAADRTSRAFEIQVVDGATGRGVPLVELESVHRMRWVTDSAGRVAFDEPGLMDQPVFLTVRSHGYEFPRDGFGFAGRVVHPRHGQSETLTVRRLNVAERVRRLTGAGIYRDSLLLGRVPASPAAQLNSQVAGQDSTQAVVYRGHAFLCWGDTSRISYPLGNFRTTAATLPLPVEDVFAPDAFPYRYFTGPEGFTRKMCPFEPTDGLIWLDGLAVVRGEAATGEERLVAHYSRMRNLGERLEHGLVLFDDAQGIFSRLTTLPETVNWQCPQGQSTPFVDDGRHWLLFGNPFPAVRVAADLQALARPGEYEAWTCLEDGSPADPATARIAREANGAVRWRWTRGAGPLTPAQEAALRDAGRLRPEECRHLPEDVETGKTILMHGGSVRWNPWRGRWIMIAVQQGGSSYLGEVWYSEAGTPTGPWTRARKIVTHERYTFYNPVHHAFLDQENGRRIHFEGTYSREFSGNPEATPLYDYNQVLYALDLGDPRLDGVRR